LGIEFSLNQQIIEFRNTGEFLEEQLESKLIEINNNNDKILEQEKQIEELKKFKKEHGVLEKIIEEVLWEHYEYFMATDVNDKNYSSDLIDTENNENWIQELMDQIKSGKKEQIVGDIIESWVARAEVNFESLNVSSKWKKINLSALEEKNKNNLKLFAKKAQENLHQKLEEEKEKAQIKWNNLIKYHELTVNQLTKELAEKSKEIEDKSDLVREVREELEKEKSRTEKLQKEKDEEREISKEIREELEKQKKKTEELEKHLLLSSKSLSKRLNQKK